MLFQTHHYLKIMQSMTDTTKDVNDLPYEPVARDREDERSRCEKIPGYSEARILTSSLLNAEMCSTREQAQQLIARADAASMELSGTPYGFPLSSVRQ